jgi:hypothetical protein
MLRRLSALMLGSALMLFPARHLAAQTSLSVAGGIAAPVSDLGDIADLGYNLGVGLNFGGTRLPIGARIEGGLNGFGLKDFDEDVRVLTGTANAIVNFSQNADSPYLIGGLGIYNTKYSEDSESDNSAGINLGGGLRFPLGGLSTFLEVRYHSTLGDDGPGARLQFIPITFGIVF